MSQIWDIYCKHCLWSIFGPCWCTKSCKTTFYAHLSRIWKLARFTRFIRKVFATKILLSGKFSLFATLHIILSQKDLKCRILLGYLLIERQSSFWLFPFQLQRQLCETSPSPNWNSECRLSPLSLKGWRWIFYNSLFLRAGEEKSER